MYKGFSCIFTQHALEKKENVAFSSFEAKDKDTKESYLEYDTFDVSFVYDQLDHGLPVSLADPLFEILTHLGKDDQVTE